MYLCFTVTQQVPVVEEESLTLLGTCVHPWFQGERGRVDQFQFSVESFVDHLSFFLWSLCWLVFHLITASNYPTGIFKLVIYYYVNVVYINCICTTQTLSYSDNDEVRVNKFTDIQCLIHTLNVLCLCKIVCACHMYFSWFFLYLQLHLPFFRQTFYNANSLSNLFTNVAGDTILQFLKEIDLYTKIQLYNMFQKYGFYLFNVSFIYTTPLIEGVPGVEQAPGFSALEALVL